MFADLWNSCVLLRPVVDNFWALDVVHRMPHVCPLSIHRNQAVVHRGIWCRLAPFLWARSRKYKLVITQLWVKLWTTCLSAGQSHHNFRKTQVARPHQTSPRHRPPLTRRARIQQQNTSRRLRSARYPCVELLSLMLASPPPSYPPHSHLYEGPNPVRQCSRATGLVAAGHSVGRLPQVACQRALLDPPTQHT